MTYGEELDLLNESISSMQEKGEPVPEHILNKALLLAVKRDCFQEGVADTEARMIEEGKEAYDHIVAGLDKTLADERANGAALAAAVKVATWDLRRDRVVDDINKALAAYNASQGPEENHE